MRVETLHPIMRVGGMCSSIDLSDVSMSVEYGWSRAFSEALQFYFILTLMSNTVIS